MGARIPARVQPSIRNKALEISREQINLQVHRLAFDDPAESGHSQRMRDQVQREPRRLHRIHGQAHAVDCDRSLHRNEPREIFRRFDLESVTFSCRSKGDNDTHAVNMP